GVSLNRSGDFKNSINYLKKARTIMPRNADVYIALGCSYFQLGDKRAAIENYRTALKYSTKPAGKAYVFLCIAVIYNEAGNRDYAIIILNKAQQLDPNNAYIHFQLGAVQIEKALGMYNKLYSIHGFKIGMVDGKFLQGIIQAGIASLNCAGQICSELKPSIDKLIKDFNENELVLSLGLTITRHDGKIEFINAIPVKHS
ncbi:MAG: tetratricopeptide repeat protein, partial [Candidatus Margulisiibacteriota bacterium]